MIYSYKLKFNSPLHISNERSDYASGSSFLRSDTLYAAIAWAWGIMGKEEWISTLTENDMSLSSCFPFYIDNYFFPRPKFSYKIDKSAVLDTTLKKKIKKIEWVDQEILMQILKGNDPQSKSQDNFLDTFWSSKKIVGKSFLSGEVFPRVMVPRDNGDTKIYYIEKHFFDSESGLYFLASFENEHQKNQLEIALNLLSEEGFGTDRNVGHGKFTYSVEKFVMPDLQTKIGLAYSLGLFIPDNKAEMLNLLSHEQKGYDLIKRGGWLSEPYLTLRKRQVYMFTEGSVFKTLKEGEIMIAGKTVDLKPSGQHIDVAHPIWRCGRTIFINF